MARSFSEIERIVARYDAATTELDQAVTGRIADSLDASYRNLERELRRLYPTWQSDGSLFAVQRRLLLMEQLGEVLQVVRPEMQAEYEALFAEALQISHESGGRMADELVRARDPGYPLAEFTTVPIEAAIAQARDGVQRLYRYNDEFKVAVSGVVEQGLLQGWGADKVARILRGNEQMQGRFGLAQLKSKAETIARTEIMSSFDRATQQRYAENGITHIQWLVTPSEGLCSYCLARHGNVYKLGEVTAPSHPRCRCITTSWLPKWQERGWTQDEAIAADKTQRLEEMAKLGTKPNAGPTYWERRAGLTEAPTPVWKPGDAAPKAAAAVVERPAAAKPNQAYFDKWADSYKDAPPLFKRVLDRFAYPEEIPSDGTAGAYHLRGKIHMGTFEPGVGRSDSVWRHEYGHHVDRLIGNVKDGAGSPKGYISSSPEGSKAMGADMRSLNKAKKSAVGLDYGSRRELEAKAKFAANVPENYQKILGSAPPVYRLIDQTLNASNSVRDRELIASAILRSDPDLFISLSERAIATRYQGTRPVVAADLAGAVTKNNVGFGHTKAYYKDPGMRETEAFANAFSMLSSGDELELEVARYIAPSFTRFVEKTLESL